MRPKESRKLRKARSTLRTPSWLRRSSGSGTSAPCGGRGHTSGDACARSACGASRKTKSSDVPIRRVCKGAAPAALTVANLVERRQRLYNSVDFRNVTAWHNHSWLWRNGLGRRVRDDLYPQFAVTWAVKFEEEDYLPAAQR